MDITTYMKILFIDELIQHRITKLYLRAGGKFIQSFHDCIIVSDLDLNTRCTKKIESKLKGLMSCLA